MIQKYRDLPPRKQIWLWLAALMVLIPMYLLASGVSLREAEDRFRRLEAAELLGPMKILGQTETDAGNYPQALLAADEHTAAVYLYSPYGELLLSEKRDGPFVLLSGAYVSSLSWYAQQEEPLILPLILFDRHPRAVRAELTIGSGDITLTSVRDGSGWFRFDLDTSGFGAEEYQLLQTLHTMTTRGTGDAVQCTAKFYGASGDLIAQEMR